MWGKTDVVLEILKEEGQIECSEGACKVARRMSEDVFEAAVLVGAVPSPACFQGRQDVFSDRWWECGA